MLDDVINGLYGLPGSGKTTVMTAAAVTVVKIGRTVIIHGIKVICPKSAGIPNDAKSHNGYIKAKES